MNITDLPSLKANSALLNAELDAVFAKFGMKIKKQNSAIGQGVCRFTIECAYGSAEDQTAIARAAWERWAPSFSLPVDAFGSVITLNGEDFKIAGIDIGKPKNCVSLSRVKDGRGFKCPAATAINAIMRRGK